MALFSFGFIYKTTDFTPAKYDIGPTINPISASATPLHMTIEDNDGVWEDTVNNAPSGQTLDTTQQWLDEAFDGHPVHSAVRLRCTFEVQVTLPDGTIVTGKANQLRLTDATTGGATDYIIFQFPVLPGSTVQFVSTSPLGNTAYSDFPCYGAGSLIATPAGERRIEDLASGDLVMTLDRGPQPIRWIGRRHFSAADLAARPDLRPIRIAAGSLGGGLPVRDLLVSPQHRMLLRSRIAGRMFGCAEIMVPAKKLLSIPGISLAEEVTDVTYVHFLCQRHEVVMAEGAPSESLFPGPEALRMLGPEAVQEILTIFPELATTVTGGDDRAGVVPLLARLVVRGAACARLLDRHAKNNRPLLAAV